jgi:hypothetical protein
MPSVGSNIKTKNVEDRSAKLISTPIPTEDLTLAWPTSTAVNMGGLLGTSGRQSSGVTNYTRSVLEGLMRPFRIGYCKRRNNKQKARASGYHGVRVDQRRSQQPEEGHKQKQEVVPEK